MNEDRTFELWLQHRVEQDKYTYFLLAVAASAIAFAVQKTGDAVFAWRLVPLGLAVLAWGLSFYYGCQNLLWSHTALSANIAFIQLKSRVQPQQAEQAELSKAVRGTREALKSHIGKTEFYAKYQFWLAIVGAVLFLVWHLVEIYFRTAAVPS